VQILNLILEYYVGGDETRCELLWILSLVLEFAAYPVAHYLVSVRHQIKMAVDHMVERNELWVILILGESIVELGVTVPVLADGVTLDHSNTAEYFEVLMISLVISYMLLQCYSVMQPAFQMKLDTHAYDLSNLKSMVYSASNLFATFGLLNVAVGLKLLILHVNDGKYKYSKAIFLTGGIAFTLVWLNIGRAMHEWALPVPYTFCGTTYNIRMFLWIVHTIMSCCTVFLAYMMPMRLWLFVLIIFLYLGVLLFIDKSLKPSDDVYDIFKDVLVNHSKRQEKAREHWDFLRSKHFEGTKFLTNFNFRRNWARLVSSSKGLVRKPGHADENRFSNPKNKRIRKRIITEFQQKINERAKADALKWRKEQSRKAAASLADVGSSDAMSESPFEIEDLEAGHKDVEHKQKTEMSSKQASTKGFTKLPKKIVETAKKH